MHVSGILILSRPGAFEACREEVASCPGAEVHYTDPSGQRLIAVLEAESFEDQEAGLRRLQALPHVAAAELVCHYLPDQARPAPASSGAPAP